jgi:hypothetical protein
METFDLGEKSCTWNCPRIWPSSVLPHRADQPDHLHTELVKDLYMGTSTQNNYMNCCFQYIGSGCQIRVVPQTESHQNSLRFIHIYTIFQR